MSLLDIFRPQVNYNLIQYESPTRAYINGLSVADFYRKQPHLQTVVSFVSQNIAQLPIYLYAKGANGDRRRVEDISLSGILRNPNDQQSTYDLILQTASEYKLYGEAFWYVSYGKDRLHEIHVIPNRYIARKEKKGIEYTGLVLNYNQQTIPWHDIIHFHNYDPLSNGGLSPVESLKHILAEQVDAWEFRRKIWKNRGMFNEYISRPKDVEPMTDATVTRFRDNFSAAWNGRQAGKLPLLEDGMEIKSAPFNARELQWLESAQLSLDTVSAVYHIRSSLVGGSSAQSYASAKDNARALYQDALAPDLRMITETLNARLIPMLGFDNRKYYFEFDITAKLEGSLTEQAESLKTLVQGSVMKLSEARERLNLTHVDGSDALLIPLNSTLSTYLEDVQVNTEKAVAIEHKDTTQVHTKSDDEAEEVNKTVIALQAAILDFFRRQERSLSSAWGAGNHTFNRDRWNKELANAIEPHFFDLEKERIIEVVEHLPIDAVYSQEVTKNFITSMARKRAEMINDKTVDSIKEHGNIKDAFKDKKERADFAGHTIEAAIAGFMAQEVISQNRADLEKAGYTMFKTWRTTSGNPRPAHAATDGETVPWNEPFSLGGYYPGDTRMPADLVVNCRCVLDTTFEKEK